MPSSTRLMGDRELGEIYDPSFAIELSKELYFPWFFLDVLFLQVFFIFFILNLEMNFSCVF